MNIFVTRPVIKFQNITSEKTRILKFNFWQFSNQHQRQYDLRYALHFYNWTRFYPYTSTTDSLCMKIFTFLIECMRSKISSVQIKLYS